MATRRGSKAKAKPANGRVTPFLKWAGGKRWLVASHPDLLEVEYTRYVEPFLGSGAVFFHLRPAKALLSDCNSELIEAFLAVRDDWERVLSELRRHSKRHDKDYYYKVRSTKYRSAHGRAAQLIYLNRTCWNGLYRVNQNGQFNVPIGTKTNVLLNTDDFENVSQVLRRAKIVCADFEDVINQTKIGDFLFIDPPYTVKHNRNNFIKYNETLFSWGDQVRLRDAVSRARKRGVRAVITNASCSAVKKLYSELGVLHQVKRISLIAGDSSKRKTCDELVVEVCNESNG